MRRGFPSLALQVQEVLRKDPLSCHLLVFRGRRRQQATFYIQFSFCDNRVSAVPAVKANPAGIAIPARQGFDVHLHG
ncbi:transposase [Bradyrhizobium sp. 173]|uniref:transposase n=1 Tax=Bradyrhizobium sp. 173 TaxID=2782644 RepID=UPI001FF8D71B|nr:transposase [Bradyrhizobium sp. 173]